MSFIYKGLEATYSRHIVTGEEVERQLERLRRETPKITPVLDRPAALGDTLTLDYAGFCGGEQFAGGTAQNQTLTLGSHTFIPGFEEQLVGSRPGEQVEVKVTFPRDYHAAGLAGKEAVFRCTVHQVSQQSAYGLDDSFAQALGAKDLEQLREDLGRSLQDYADRRGELDLGDRLLRKAADTLDFQPTQEQVEAATAEQMETLRSQLARQGLTMEMYSQFTGKTVEQLRQDARDEAEQTVRIYAAIDEISRLEGLAVTEQDLADALAEICRQNHITMEQLQAVYDETFAAAVERNIRMNKAMTLVRKAAVLREE